MNELGRFEYLDERIHLEYLIAILIVLLLIDLD